MTSLIAEMHFECRYTVSVMNFFGKIYLRHSFFWYNRPVKENKNKVHGYHNLVSVATWTYILYIYNVL